MLPLLEDVVVSEKNDHDELRTTMEAANGAHVWSRAETTPSLRLRFLPRLLFVFDVFSIDVLVCVVEWLVDRLACFVWLARGHVFCVLVWKSRY